MTLWGTGWGSGRSASHHHFPDRGNPGQSVRVLVAALALKVVTPLEFNIVFGLLDCLRWDGPGWVGCTVIWTDVMQFFLFVGAGLSLFWIISHIDGGWGEMMTTLEAGKLPQLTTIRGRVYPVGGNYRSTFPKPQCLWGGPVECPADVLLPGCQRCEKGNIASSAALLLTTLMLFVGTAIYAFYEPMRAAGTEPAIFAEDGNYVYPVWIVTGCPLDRGLILAGIFAAAISSLDSTLAAPPKPLCPSFGTVRK